MSSDLSHQQIGQAIGVRLRTARLVKKFTQSQLANPGFSVSYVSAIERGQIHPSLRALEIFAQRLGLSSTDLLSKQTSGEANGLSAMEGSTQSEEEVDLQFLEAQIFVQQGASQQAVTHLRNLLSTTLTPQQEIRLHYLLGWAYYNLNRFQEAESALAEALKLIKDPNDDSSLHILNLLGIVQASMGNYTLALEYHQRSLDRLEKKQQPYDAFFIASIYTSMGMHYTHLDKFGEAIHMFQRALAMTENLTTPGKLGSMYWNASRYYAETKDYFDATLYGQKYLELHSQEYSNSLRSKIYHYLGRILIQGDQQRASAYFEKMLESSSVIQDTLTFASVSTGLAELLLKQGKIDDARKHAQEAYESAAPYGDDIITTYALIMLGRTAYAQNDFETGDANFVAGLEMLERMGFRDERADQSAFYAQLLEDRGLPQEALKYYKKAFESRRKSD